MQGNNEIDETEYESCTFCFDGFVIDHWGTSSCVNCFGLGEIKKN